MKRFGNFIKYTKSDYQGISFIKQDGKLITNPDMKANTMHHQFHSVFPIAENYSSDEFDKRCNMPADSEFPKMSDITIQCKGVVKLLLKLFESSRTR